MYTDYLPSPLGMLEITASDSGITGVHFCNAKTAESPTGTSPLLKQAKMQLTEYFNGKRTGFSLPLDVKGTPFQQTVWAALQTIPYGETRSYAQIAQAVGSPKACRAVGMANHSNPVAILVPCHRVIGKDGSLTGYAGGLAAKKGLLALEQQYKAQKQTEPMRRSDREITDFKEILTIMEQCDVCRLAFNDIKAPYILPLNFGMEVRDRQIYLYFHGAAEGAKYARIERSPTVSFEMDCAHRLVSDAASGYCTMEYKSVIGYGTIERITNEQEKISALTHLVNHYHKQPFPFNPAALPRTAVMRLTVESMRAKARCFQK